jgi:hypothetical protein
LLANPSVEVLDLLLIIDDAVEADPASVVGMLDQVVFSRLWPFWAWPGVPVPRETVTDPLDLAAKGGRG